MVNLLRCIRTAPLVYQPDTLEATPTILGMLVFRLAIRVHHRSNSRLNSLRRHIQPRILLILNISSTCSSNRCGINEMRMQPQLRARCRRRRLDMVIHRECLLLRAHQPSQVHHLRGRTS